jgi:hypothetical protein
MQHLKGSGTPVLYIGRTVLKGNVSDIQHVQHEHKCSVAKDVQHTAMSVI